MIEAGTRKHRFRRIAMARSYFYKSRGGYNSIQEHGEMEEDFRKEWLKDHPEDAELWRLEPKN